MIRQSKRRTAAIGFWLVLGANKKHPLLVCPAVVRDEAVDIAAVSMKEAWNAVLQIPADARKDVLVFMIPEIVNITDLKKHINKYKNLWEIDSIKAKCEALTVKYINHIKAVNEQLCQ